MDKLTASKGIKALAKSLIASSKPTIEVSGNEVSGKNGLDEKQVVITADESIATLIESVKGKGYLMFLVNTLDHEARRVKSFMEAMDSFKDDVMKELKSIEGIKNSDLFAPTSKEDYEIKGTNICMSKLITVTTGKDKKEIYDVLKNRFGAKFNVVLK